MDRQPLTTIPSELSERQNKRHQRAIKKETLFVVTTGHTLNGINVKSDDKKTLSRIKEGKKKVSPSKKYKKNHKNYPHFT